MGGEEGKSHTQPVLLLQGSQLVTSSALGVEQLSRAAGVPFHEKILI